MSCRFSMSETRTRRQQPTDAMQRLYSTFPGSWPGFALLMLRCVAAVALIACANADGWFSRPPAVLLVDPAVLLVDGAIVVASALLIGGLWTPAAGIAQA